MDNHHIYTVSELNSRIRSLLEHRFPFLSVSGEISNLRRPYSGHLYFTLKDDQGQIKAVLFKMQQRYLLQQPADGQAVICRGRLTVYEPRGDYQLIVDSIDFHGAGALQIAFEQLKKKLAAEGLFADEHKKPLPEIPRHITLITSPGGAAVHDFIRIARRRFPQIQLAVYPVAVQGGQAAKEMIDALTLVHKKLSTDIIVLCRGGGSIEDLQPFNDEQLARTIFSSKIPIVSAVGHEIDFTIADFVSDLRAPTPSAAAELVLPDASTLKEKITTLRDRLGRLIERQLDHLEDRLALQRQILGDLSSLLSGLFLRVDQQSILLVRSMENILAANRERISTLQLRLERSNPEGLRQVSIGRLTGLQKRLARAIRQILLTKKQLLRQQITLLEAVSPQATLARGYAIVRKKQTGEVVLDSSDINPGEQARILLHRGQLDVTVESCAYERETYERET
jgi:exodeoxyribonuclease VII large subunit